MIWRRRAPPVRPDRDIHPTTDTVLSHVLALLNYIGGIKEAGAADQGIVGELRITGSDGIDLLEMLEEDYGIDLRPFIDARTERRKGRFRTYSVTRDTTPRELAAEIERLLRERRGADE